MLQIGSQTTVFTLSPIYFNNTLLICTSEFRVIFKLCSTASIWSSCWALGTVGFRFSTGTNKWPCCQKNCCVAVFFWRQSVKCDLKLQRYYGNCPKFREIWFFLWCYCTPNRQEIMESLQAKEKLADCSSIVSHVLLSKMNKLKDDIYNHVYGCHCHLCLHHQIPKKGLVPLPDAIDFTW